MNDHQAFMKAIIAKPKDNVIRLVYADWLEEQGQMERAEFIRIQCGPSSGLDPQTCKKLEKREKEILKKNSYRWVREVFSSARRDIAKNWIFHRGFPIEIECELEEWHQWGNLLLNAFPTIEKVWISGKGLMFTYGEQSSWEEFVPTEEDQVPRPYEIPQWLFAHLKKTDFLDAHPAMVALSDACIRWAKAQNESRKRK